MALIERFEYFSSYLLQSSSLRPLQSSACVPAMPGSISENHFVKALSAVLLFYRVSAVD
jgi:hypothetical protein